MDTPIDKLSDNTLSDIFLRLSNMKQCRTDRYEGPAKDAPWNCAAVCQRWRAITLCDPRLWTHINMSHTCQPVEYQNQEPLYANTGDMLRCHLKLDRSKNMPLSLDFTGYEPCPCGLAMLQILIHHAQRWRTLQVYSPENYIGDDLHHLLPHDQALPQLESLLYHCSHGLQLPLFPNPAALCNLRSLTLMLVGETQDGELITGLGLEHLLFGQLQSLDINIIELPLEHVSDLLRACGNLKRLKIGLTNTETDVMDVHDIRLKDLEELEVIHARVVQCPAREFLDLLEAPRLRSISWPLIAGPLDTDALRGMIRRSSCQITHLLLEAPEDDAGDDAVQATYSSLPSLFGELQRLNTLVLENRNSTRRRYVHWANEVLRLLVYDERSPSPPIRLQHLEFCSVTFEPSILLAMIQSRARFSSQPPNVEPCGYPIESLLLAYRKADPFPKVLQDCLVGHVDVRVSLETLPALCSYS